MHLARVYNDTQSIILPSKITRITNLRFGILRQRLPIPTPILRTTILRRTRPRPLQLQNQMVVPVPLQLIHRLGRLLPLRKTHKRKPPALQRLLVFRHVHPADPPEPSEQLLEVGLGGIFRYVGDTDGVLVAVVLHAFVGAAFGISEAACHGGEGSGSASFGCSWCAGGTTACGGGYVLVTG